MQVRYRILEGKHDPELARISRQADRDNNPFIVVGGDTRYETPPQAISAVEGTASLAQLRTLLAGGDLKLRDLVDVGNGWETVEECHLLDDITEPYRRRAAHLKTLFQVGIWVLIAVVLGTVVTCLSSIGVGPRDP